MDIGFCPGEDLFRMFEEAPPGIRPLLVVPVNRVVRRNGELVMGAGMAKEASLRYPHLPKAAGDHLSRYPGDLTYLLEERFIFLATKEHWKERSSMDLLARSLMQLRHVLTFLYTGEKWAVLMPQIGCGYGGLSWDEVRPLIVQTFDPLFAPHVALRIAG